MRSCPQGFTRTQLGSKQCSPDLLAGFHGILRGRGGEERGGKGREGGKGKEMGGEGAFLHFFLEFNHCHIQ